MKLPEKSTDGEIRSRLASGILKGAERWLTPEEVRAVQVQYFGNAKLPAEDPQQMNWFLQWLCHDFVGHTGRSLVDHFAARQGHNLPLRDREILRAWQKSYPAICEVDRVSRGEGLHVHDVVSGEKHFVCDVMGSRSMSKGEWTLCRLEVLDGKTGFVSDSIGVPQAARSKLLDYIDEQAAAAGVLPVEYVRRAGNLLYRTINEIGEEWVRHLRIVNREGDKVEQCVAEYLVLDEPALAAILRSLPEFEEVPPENGGLAFIWLEEVAGTGSARFGTITVHDGRLKLITESQTRLQLGRGRLEANAGKYLRHRGDEVVTQEELKEQILRKPARNFQAPKPPPSDEDLEIVLAFKTEHYRTWPDHPLPALKGKTPRAAIKSQAGRQAVIRLIREMEADEVQAGDPAYDFNVLRRDLGLADE